MKDRIENVAIIPRKDYVFCYFLGDCAWQRRMVQKYADKYGLMILDIPYILGTDRRSDHFLKSEKHYDIGPREFVSLVKKAKCVFTDSFHAVAFSVNFNTDFYVFDRDGLSGSKSINSRITDFLDLLKLSDRRITSPESEISDIKIDYESVKPILEKERLRSLEWLKDHLN